MEPDNRAVMKKGWEETASEFDARMRELPYEEVAYRIIKLFFESEHCMESESVRERFTIWFVSAEHAEDKEEAFERYWKEWREMAYITN
jgi:hypothetical protein